MKKKSLIIIGLFIALTIVISLIVLLIINKKENTNQIPTVSQIELNSPQYINQLEKVKIKNTNDNIIITKRVKWEVPDHDEYTTISFSISIPYTITVDGKEYNGIYELNDRSWSTPDNNPKYDFDVINLTQNGDIKVIIRIKEKD